jgi:hypothetical protein
MERGKENIVPENAVVKIRGIKGTIYAPIQGEPILKKAWWKKLLEKEG